MSDIAKTPQWRLAREMNQSAFNAALPDLQARGLQGNWAVVMDGKIAETWNGYDAAIKHY